MRWKRVAKEVRTLVCKEVGDKREQEKQVLWEVGN
jgi:hypothetical protein